MIQKISFFDDAGEVNSKSAIEKLNEWTQDNYVKIINININSKGGERVSKDTEICFSSYLEVWYYD